MISSKQIILMFTAIIVGLAPLFYYLWSYKIWNIRNLNKKTQYNSYPVKDCTLEIHQAILDHKARNKAIKEQRAAYNRNGRIVPRVQVSSYDVNNWDGVPYKQNNSYLTREYAYPECSDK